MNADLSILKQQEERKREAAYDPVKRWQHIQQTITWAEANLPPRLRRNRPRTPKFLVTSPPRS
jgi:hypothetical protein